MQKFKLVSPFSPMGDQEEAIKQLVAGIKEGKKEQVLLGGTGTGKTFTVSNVIAAVNKPTLVLAHNKTLAGQLYSELKEFFLKIELNILFQTSISINRKLIFLGEIYILIKMLKQTMKLRCCAVRQ